MDEGSDGRQRLAQDNVSPDLIIVCGLGRLGQHCAHVLKAFGVTVHGIDEGGYDGRMELVGSSSGLDRLVVGDCRLTTVLEAAEIARCRAILLVTGSEQVNVTAAFAARLLNPRVRLVLRSAGSRLNRLLEETLGNLVAYDPAQLSTAAFALAGMVHEQIGLLTLDGRHLPILREVITAGHRLNQVRTLYEINTRNRRLLSHRREGEGAERLFDWDPSAPLRVGDTITWIDLGGEPALAPFASDRRWPNALMDLIRENQAWPPDPRRWREALRRLWRESDRGRRAVMLSGLAMFALFLFGVVCYGLSYPDMGIYDAINVAMVLTLGGFDNLFGQRTLPFPITPGLYVFSVLLTVAGTAFVGVLYAWLTERILSARFSLRAPSPPAPSERHVVLVGLEQTGHRVARLLMELRQPLVAVVEHSPSAEAPPRLPLIVGPLPESLGRANLETASSVIAMTDDDVKNVEIALTVRAANPACRLVIRTDDANLSRGLSRLIPGVQAFGACQTAADAYAGAAFGENILGTLHLGDGTVLTTEYRIVAADTLTGMLLSEVACGYRVVPLLHRDAETGTTEILPSEDIRLEPGDRLVVLATIDGLKAIELGRRIARTKRIRIDRAMTSSALFAGAMAIARIAGCEPGVARLLMAELPATLDLPLYGHQAQRLADELGRERVTATVIDLADAP